MGEPKVSNEVFPSTTFRKIQDSHSASNFEEIIFLNFLDKNFQNFGASSLAEKKVAQKWFLTPEMNSWGETTLENIFFYVKLKESIGRLGHLGTFKIFLSQVHPS